MRPKKPCAQCAHGKSKHRKRECRHTWQTLMGNRIITKWCSCDGYKDQEDQ